MTQHSEPPHDTAHSTTPRRDPYRDHLNLSYRISQPTAPRPEVRSWWGAPLALLILIAPALVWLREPYMVLGGIGTLTVLLLFGDLEWHIRPFWTRHWWTRHRHRPTEHRRVEG